MVGYWMCSWDYNTNIFNSITMKTTNFNYWMANVVKSIHYANNDLMLKAFERFRNTELKRHNYIFNSLQKIN